ncbi:hypothetical protein Egran_00982 [Elaphomyces granulatus]|uniref:Phospholipid/glycerol acyltransferase domain-containing protein n=1 Tax=Elaphomyces granulatus TaxID=519963 RepID=A0A232M4B2_9EURO|nr:hypothetical protein Egran_00982 [Elaphomyces granulatus]
MKIAFSGSGIAPFFPISPPPAGFQLPLRVFLFFFRLPLLLAICLIYFLVLQWLPIGSLGKKASLWCILGVPCLWWVDLQVDGVRRGDIKKESVKDLSSWCRSLAKQQRARLPNGGSIIASSMTSPIDALYLAAIFDPIFTASYPNHRSVERLSLFQAILRPFSFPTITPPLNARMVDPASLLERYPHRPVVMFPECTTTNGRAILPLSPSLVAVPPKTKIYPVSVRYTPADVSTPIPRSYLSFLWNLLSKPTHCIRVRIAECVIRGGVERHYASTQPAARKQSMFEGDDASVNLIDNGVVDDDPSGSLTSEEKALLDYIGDALARLGRVKRIGLSIQDKQEFVRMWTKSQRK